MEDEGRESIAGHFPSVEAAFEWIGKQSGYFHPSDYYVPGVFTLPASDYQLETQPSYFRDTPGADL